MVYGIKSGREIQKGEGCERLFSHIEKKIVLNIQEGDVFCRLIKNQSKGQLCQGGYEAGWLLTFQDLRHEIEIGNRPVIFQHVFV